MTAPEELDHEAGARFMEKLLAEDPEKLCVATDEQVDAMMDRAGIEVGPPETAEQMLARVERRRRERQAGAKRGAAPAVKAAPKKATSRRLWVAGAVVAAAAAAVVAVEIAESKHEHEAIGPDHPGPSPSPQQQAAWLRTDALAACNAQDLATCTAKLDEAKRLDPAGESDPRVVQMRELLAVPSAPTQAPSTPEKPELKPR